MRRQVPRYLPILHLTVLVTRKLFHKVNNGTLTSIIYRYFILFIIGTYLKCYDVIFLKIIDKKCISMFNCYFGAYPTSNVDSNKIV